MLQPFQESLDRTINKIKKNMILLPNFQRQFVWKDEENQKSLVASVLTKMPIGSILLLKARNANEYACKALGSSKRLDPNSLGKGDVEFLLDGQQRLTVLANVFSDVIFDLSAIGDLIAPMALKRRFFLALPRYASGIEDLFGLHSLDFPLDKPDSDDPDFQTADVYEYIRVLKFSKTSKDYYNPYYHDVSKLSKLESFCQNPEEKFYYIPLFLLIDSSKASMKNTTLSRIIKSIAENVAKAKVEELASMMEGSSREEIKEYIKNDLIEDAYEEYFDESCYANNDDNIIEAYQSVLNIQADGWSSNMLLYIKSCITQINLSQISLDDSQKARAIDIYENLNRGGVSLDIYDLLMARVTLENPEPYNERLKKYISSPACYINELVPAGIKADYKKLSGYKASVSMACYDDNKKEFPKNYLDSFLNVLSLISYRPKLTHEEYHLDLLKRNKKLSLTPDLLDKNCEPSCKAIDRACFFFQTRCGLRKFKEINFILMVPIVAYILHDDECYSGKHGEDVFNLLEAWYWINIFSGQFDRDQNARIITDLNLLVDCILDIKHNKKPNLKWLLARKTKVLDMPGYSDQSHILMENAENEEYPKNILSTAICQYYLSEGYYDLLKDNNGNMRHMSVFAPDSDKYQMHHVIPLGADCTVAESTDNIRKNKKHLLNSPLNMLYITDLSNLKISNAALDSYTNMIPKGSGLTNVGFPSSSISISATEKEKKELLKQRYSSLVDAIQLEITTLLDFTSIHGEE